ncbi:CRISPR-associated protein Cas5 [Clostridioides difficile]|uniref:CRISPR-associated protein Cas5 n=1 Tax=Clostridioides difficile TaxID=1496 RepID=UPI0003B2A2A3|nr:CRISPR-associated protein Cas5 [Clostridioides difficile]EGT4598833.1 CRISPR-associated protein Cas5 [Clostridioides difficile]MDI3116833.1 CRISPR-associated protein Cas5 [Clostridioides difficile]CCL08503.1 Crispr-associated protein cas5 family [Clostridioides difficile CD002]VIF73934.1 CRISPR-associated protein cas5 family [Clostridioides difficile]VIG64083.1 CRISPR-associated protein cas5 family [Clostridioides difficile]
MILNKIEIIGDMAHFKIPMHSKIQRTYEIPPISTVVGILKNIYGEEIDDFILGYVIYHNGTFKDLQTIYKEINPNVKTLTDSDRFQTDVCPIEYLINPKLIIYTNIDKNIEFNEPLCLGKTNCLAKVLSLSEIEVNLIDKKAIGYNQYTDINIGDGMIKRINTLTEYNEKKGYYDIYSSMVRENDEFEYGKYYDEDEQQNIFLWNWKKGGVIKCI